MTADTPPPDVADPDEGALAEFLERAFIRYASGEPVRPAELLAGAPHLVPRAEQLLADVRELFAAVVGVRSASRSLVAPAADGDELPDYFPGEFRLARRLGQGAFGQVWMADDLHLGRPVALKLIRPAGDRAEADRRVAALRAEARLLAAVRHRNVAAVYALREATGADGRAVQVLVEQFVAGGSLADRVRLCGPLRWADAARFAAGVADGLAAVHAAGVVHRDVKPGNVLWDEAADEAVLTDFGVSTRLSDVPPAGTLPYMPPEAFEGRVGPAQDVYGLAATLFWLVTGGPPFPGLTPAALTAQVRNGLPDPDPRCACVPARVEAIVRRGLAADPRERPSAAEFGRLLRGALNQGLSDALAAPPGLAASGPGPRVTVSRLVGTTAFAPIATTHPESDNRLRDLTRVPPEPDRAVAFTGERVRVEVEPPAAGYLTVFNVGPTGNLTVLFPDAPGDGLCPPAPVAAGQSVRIIDLALTPPTGDERVVAVWTREAVPLRPDELLRAATGSDLPVSAGFRATRDLKKISEATAPADRRVTVLTLRHVPPGASR
jgi:serine/threonine protein kinase